MPLFFSIQYVSYSILLLVSILTIGGWLAAIFHYKSVIFSDQGTRLIDSRLPTHKINPSLLHYHVPSRLLQRGYDLWPAGMYEPWNKQMLIFNLIYIFRQTRRCKAHYQCFTKYRHWRGHSYIHVHSYGCCARSVNLQVLFQWPPPWWEQQQWVYSE